MKEAVLERKIDNFLSSKIEKYPELHAPVAQLTRELIAQDTGGST